LCSSAFIACYLYSFISFYSLLVCLFSVRFFFLCYLLTSFLLLTAKKYFINKSF
jgi:hypothetical protein